MAENIGTSQSPKEFRRKLIQEEFRDFLTHSDYKVPLDTDAIIVLSGPLAVDEQGIVKQETAANDIARVEVGIEIAYRVAATRAGKGGEALSIEDLIRHAPRLVLDGTNDQLLPLRNIALGFGFPEEKIAIVDCGAPGVGNTKTQFEVLNSDARLLDARKLTFVTDAWHAPRVVRTGDAHLKHDIDFEVIPVPSGTVPYNVFRVVRGEVSRIERYAAKGDIAAVPSRGRRQK